MTQQHNSDDEKIKSTMHEVAAKLATGNPRGAEELVNSVKKYQPTIEKLVKGIAEQLTALQPLMQQLRDSWTEILPSLLQIFEGIRNMPPAYRSALILLGERGWYMDGEMGLSTPVELAQKLINGNVEEAELSLEAHFTARLDDIEAALISSYPFRKKIIKAAFWAHRSGQYECSIPVLLTQIDGMCFDTAGSHLFIRSKIDQRPKVAVYAEQISDNTLTAAFLAPLTMNLPISANQKERGVDFWQLNRHAVLHGESVDYASERNSLRAVSLINYIMQMLGEAHVKRPRQSISN